MSDALDWALREARSGQRARGGTYLDTVPVIRMPCQFVFTGKAGSNGKRFWVRCRCQAQTKSTPRQAFWNYDPLGDVGSLTEGLALWRAHVAAEEHTA